MKKETTEETVGPKTVDTWMNESKTTQTLESVT